jgi:SnoaL-like domain
MQMTNARKTEERSKHWLGNARTTIWDSRAVLETDFMILTRDFIDGHLFDYTSWGRFLDQIEKRDGVWRILRWSTIYDKDRLDPVIPGAVPAAYFDSVRLEGHGSGFAFMQFRQDKHGRAAPPGLVFGHTEAERRLRDDVSRWLTAG